MVALGDVAEIERVTIGADAIPRGTIYLGLEHIERGGRILGRQIVGDVSVASSKFVFDAGHILYGKLRPNLGKIARPDFSGVCSTDILPIRPGPFVDRGYLAHFLVQKRMVDHAASRATGINLPRLSPSELASFQVPLPPLDEQRRIATILDQADRIASSMSASVSVIGRLESSVYNSWSKSVSSEPVRFGDLASQMRNGLSPSSRGTVAGRVLTLAAITGGHYDGTHVKRALFDREPAHDQFVSSSDFLICRGNGNRELVGIGVFPVEPENVVFPDTVIAAQIDCDRVSREFLELAWRSRAVRAQVRASARTTSGIYKVNQGGLAGVVLNLPDRGAQEQLADRVKEIREWGAGRRLAVERHDVLRASLQARAFSGGI